MAEGLTPGGVDLQQVFNGELAASFRRDANGTARAAQTMEQGGASFLNILDRVMLREYTEPSFAEAAAMKESKGNPDAQYLMGMQAGSRSPEGTPARTGGTT